MIMASFTDNYNGKVANWSSPFQRTSAFPLDRTSMFDSVEDAQKYALGDGSDKRGLGAAAHIGQIITVFENDVVTVYKIEANRTIAEVGKATDLSGLEALIDAVNKKIGTAKEGNNPATGMMADIERNANAIVDVKANWKVKDVKDDNQSVVDNNGVVDLSDYTKNSELQKAIGDIKIPVYSIAKVNTENGYSATYQLSKDGIAEGTKINIPKDFLVKDASIKTATEDNSPLEGIKAGDKYIDWVINSKDNDATEQHLYLNVKELVDVYTGSTYITVKSDNSIELNLASLEGYFNGKYAGKALEATVSELTKDGGRISEIEGSVSELQTATGNMKTDIADISEDLGTAEGNITTLQGKMGTAEGNITTLQGKMGTAEGNITTLQGKMGAAEGNITTLQGGLGTANTNITNLQNSVDKLLNSTIVKQYVSITAPELVTEYTGADVRYNFTHTSEKTVKSISVTQYDAVTGNAITDAMNPGGMISFPVNHLGKVNIEIVFTFEDNTAETHVFAAEQILPFYVGVVSGTAAMPDFSALVKYVTKDISVAIPSIANDSPNKYLAVVVPPTLSLSNITSGGITMPVTAALTSPVDIGDGRYNYTMHCTAQLKAGAIPNIVVTTAEQSL